MAYFGKAKSDGMMQRVEPRTMFLVIWIALCAVVLTLILRGGFTTPQVIASAPPVAPVVLGQASNNSNIAYVLVPRAPIAAGQKLSADLFVVEERQVQGIQDRVVKNMSDIVNAYATAPIQEKSPLLKDFITFTIPSNAVASKIPEGYRAITISVNAESGVEGWVRPGVHVDVVWITQMRSRQVITTIVEDSEVLSAERSTDTNDAQNNALPGHITLLVSVNDAQRIQLAKTSGSLSLNLRGTSDRKEQGGNTISVDGLLNKSGENLNIDSVGWIIMDNQEYEVSSSGKLKLADTKKDYRSIIQDAKKK